MNNFMFTGSALLHFITGIDELKDKEISFIENADSIDITIGDNTYRLMPELEDNADVIVTTPAAASDVEDIQQGEYNDLIENADVDVSDSIEGGIITTLVKSLLLGGMLKLAPKLMK